MEFRLSPEQEQFRDSVLGFSRKNLLANAQQRAHASGYLLAFGALVALERRAREGGSWLVALALARVGRWIVDRGLVSEDEMRAVPAELPDAELRALLAEMDAPSGRLRYLRPVLQLSETPPYWSRPPAPLGAHPPAWPERG